MLLSVAESRAFDSLVWNVKTVFFSFWPNPTEEKNKQIEHLLCEYEYVCASPFTIWKLDYGVESDVNNIE